MYLQPKKAISKALNSILKIVVFFKFTNVYINSIPFHPITNIESLDSNFTACEFMFRSTQ